MERAELARLLGAEVALQEPPAEPVVISEHEPGRFMAAFTAALPPLMSPASASHPAPA